MHVSAVVPAAAAEAKPKRTKTFAIYRFNPEVNDAKPTMQEYSVDLNT